MAFAIEEIPEDKRGKYGIGSIWAIDHERNAFLIISGGVMEATFYDLYWKDRIIRINAKGDDTLVEKIYTKDENGKDTAYGIYDVEIKLFSVDIPNTLKKDKDNILTMTGEALKVFGFSGDPKRNRNVTLKNLDDSVIQFSEQTLSEIKFQRKQLYSSLNIRK